MATPYIVAADLTAYGIVDAGGPALIPQAQRVVDQYARSYTVNGDGSRFPRLRDGLLGVAGDYAGKATLSASITSSQTTLALEGDTTGYPTGTFGGATSGFLYLRVEDEVVTATTNTAGAVSGLSRGFSATLAAAHSAGVGVYWALVPVDIRNAVCEQVAWLLAEGTTYQLRGGDDFVSVSVAGAAKSRSRVDAPLLAPMARLMMRSYMQRTGYIQAGL